MLAGPHIGFLNAWPMSLLIQAQTSDNDAEIKECLDTVLQTAKLGLIHESVNVLHGSVYTRSWFACTAALVLVCLVCGWLTLE